MTEFMCFGFLFFMQCQMPGPTVVDSFAQQCRIIRPSRSDSAETLRQINRENDRCRTARSRAQAGAPNR